MPSFRPPLLLLCVFAVLAAVANAQTAPSIDSATAPTSIDPTALTLTQQAIGALDGGAAVADVTLTGSVTRTAGSDTQSGTITLKALGNRLSKVEMNLPSGRQVEMRGQDAKGVPKSSWTGTDTTTHPVAGHNTLTDAVWFFPALSNASKIGTANAALAVSYAGQETKNGIALQHVRFAMQLPPAALASTNPKAVESAKHFVALTAIDLYIDPASALPASLRFNTHPDNNSLVDIPVEVRFSDYRPVNAVQVPFHIQKFLNGSLFLDIAIQSAAINTGLSATEFTAQ